MAEVDQVVVSMKDANGGVFKLIAVVENTQTTIDPKGRVSGTVVSVKLVNTSLQRGWTHRQSSSGEWVDEVVLSGENMETRVAPPQREFFHLWAARAGCGWG